MASDLQIFAKQPTYKVERRTTDTKFATTAGEDFIDVPQRSLNLRPFIQGIIHLFVRGN